MFERSWDQSTSWDGLAIPLASLPVSISERKWRLVGCACLNRYLRETNQASVSLHLRHIERHVANNLSDLNALHRVTEKHLTPITDEHVRRLVGTVLRSDWLSNDALGPQRNITRLAQTISELLDDDQTAQLEFLRDIIGNPFRPVTFSPSWRTEATVGLASRMYDERDFAAMPILADALQEAGCEDADILTHCREPGVHVRGCWVVDLVLGKE